MMPHKDPEKRREQQKKNQAVYKAKHRDLINERQRIARLANPEKARAAHHKWWVEGGREKTKERIKAKVVEDPYYQLRYRLRYKYGLEIDDYFDILESQRHKCLICGRKFDEKLRPAVDHCHKTMVVRGILCVDCNTAIARLKTPEVIRKAADYVEKLCLFGSHG